MYIDDVLFQEHSEPKSIQLMKTLKISVLLFFVSTSIIISCKKDESSAGKQSGNEVSTSVQVSVSDDQVTDGILSAMDAADGTEDGSADLRPATCVTVTANADLKKITVDFGSGCTSPVSGRNRSGKIIITYVGANYIQATQRSFQFVNYKTIDTVTLNGTFVQSEIAHTASAVSFNVTTSEFTFLFNDGKTHTLTTYSRNFVIDLGANLRDFADNTTTITGNTIGVNKEGQVYSVDITTPVVFKGTCVAEHIFYPASGSYDVKIGNYPKFALSWGSGSCDKILTVSYLGYSADIVLK